ILIRMADCCPEKAASEVELYRSWRGSPRSFCPQGEMGRVSRFEKRVVLAVWLSYNLAVLSFEGSGSGGRERQVYPRRHPSHSVAVLFLRPAHKRGRRSARFFREPHSSRPGEQMVCLPHRPEQRRVSTRFEGAV